MRLPTFHVSDTEFTVCSTRFVEEQRPLWEALNEWCRFHDIDPMRVPMITTIRRNVAACRVEYEQIVHDDRGRPVIDGDRIVTRPVVSQGEAPPLPFPTAPEDPA